MARKKTDSPMQEGLSMDDLVVQLMKGTNFEKSEDSNVLSQRIKVETPLIALNCMLGGGTPLGSICESFGGPRSGKSTWLYLTMAKFLNKYPNGLAMVLDNESSADDSRLAFFGVDTSRVLRLPSSSIETGFLNLLQILENKGKSEQARQMPVFVVWDSISKGLAQDGATQSRMNAQDRARVIKNYMGEVLPQIEKHPFILNLINQVVYETDKYGNRKVKSGGGIGLEHDVHFKVRTDLGKDEWDGPMLVGRYSSMHIVKSKFSPEFANIPIYIDITKGGCIDEVRSFVDYLINLEMIPNLSGYYKIEGTLVPKYRYTPYYEVIRPMWKAFRYSALIDHVKSSEHTVDFLKIALMEHIGDIYYLQREIMSDYLEEVKSKYASESDRFEFRLYREDNLVGEIVNYIQTLPELKEKLDNLLEVEDDFAVCMRCGNRLDYHENCPNCKLDNTLSKPSFLYVMSKLPTEVEEVEGNVETNEELAYEE